MDKIVAICGATGSGKTALAIALAKEFSGEIVSADSRQIYRGMDIGTAKPPRDPGYAAPLFVCEGIAHHLIDIREPDEDYTLSDYKRDAENAIADILSRAKLPILIGGTGLYMDSVLYNATLPDAPPDTTFRAEIDERIRVEGLAKVFGELCEQDPEAAYIVDGKNPRRVIRAMEIARATGVPFSASRKKGAQKYDFLKLGIDIDRETLRKRTDARIDEMMRAGLAEEVKTLLNRFGGGCGAFDAIGYIEIKDVLEGKITLPDAISLMKKKTAAYAKRQMTWFKKDTRTVWIKNTAEARDAVKQFLT